MQTLFISCTYLTDFYLSAHRFAKCKLYLFPTPIFTDFYLSSHKFTKCNLYLFHTIFNDFYLSAHRFTKWKLYLFHTPIFTDFNLSSHRFTKCKLYLFHTPISLILHLQNANCVYFIHLSSMIFICLCLDLQIAISNFSAHRFA